MAIVDTSNNFNLSRRDMTAEGVLMHRERNVIAVRATQGEQTVIQVSVSADDFWIVAIWSRLRSDRHFY